MTSINHLRNIANHAQYLRRRADAIQGAEFPDPRDQELKDLGVTLRFQANVARRTQAVSQFDHEMRLAGLASRDLVKLTGVARGTVWRWRTGPAEDVPAYARSIVSLVNRIRFLSSQLIVTQETPAHDHDTSAL